MWGAVIPSLVSMMSGIYKSIDDNKRRKLGLPPRPESTLTQTLNKCQPCVTKFKEENEPKKTETQPTRTPEEDSPQSNYSPPFDFTSIISTHNNNTTFGGGSFGGAGASADW